MTHLRPAPFVVAVLLLLGACGGDGAGPDAAVADAGIDAEVDAAIDRCELLCACTTDFCNDTTATCMTQCAGLEVSVRECRIEHCGYAQTNPGFHCPHALGDGNAAGVPPECVAN